MFTDSGFLTLMMPSVLWENFIRTPAVLCSFLLPTLKSLQLDTELTLSVSDILLINYQFAWELIVYIASLMVLMVLRTVSSNFNFLVTYLHRFFFVCYTHSSSASVQNLQIWFLSAHLGI